MSLILLLAGVAALVAIGWIIKVPAVGLQNFLTDLTTNDLNNNLKFRLFTNNITPANSDVLGTYTEATFAGYAAQVATGWTAPLVSGLVAQTTGNNLVFNNTSGANQTIYGVFVTDNPGVATKLYFAERDVNAPIVIPNGGSYIYTPNFQDQSMN